MTRFARLAGVLLALGCDAPPAAVAPAAKAPDSAALASAAPASAAPASAAPASAAPASAAPADARSQHDLAAALEAAEASRDDSALSRLRAEWLGRRYRWQVRYVPALCRSAEQCHVAPFEGDAPRRPGWTPRLVLDPAAFAALQQRCPESCRLEVEATLSQLVASWESLTRLVFTDVRFPG